MNLFSIFAFFFQVTLLLAQVPDRNTLRFAQVIFRHGDRNPRFLYGTYASNIDTLFPEGVEQLTDLGKKHAFELGQFLRERYDGFLSPEYKGNEILVVSSPLERCIKTAISCMVGLYKDYSNAATWSNDHAGLPPIEPIPLRVMPEEYDNFFSLNAVCPERKRLTNVPASTFFEERYFKDEPDILEDILRHSGEAAVFGNPPNSTLIHRVFDSMQEVIHCLNFAGKPLEEWMEPLVHKEIFLAYPYVLQLAEHIDGLQAQRLNTGPLIQWIQENISAHLKGTLDKKVIFFSAHDKTIVNVMNIFDVLPILNNRVPPYASALLMELHEIPEYDEPVIELWYRNSTTQSLHKLDSPSCGVPCTLGSLAKITSDLINVNLEKEC